MNITDNKEPYFIYEEVEQIISKLKNNKATSHDLILNEQIKYGCKLLVTKLTEYFNAILHTQIIPENLNYLILF